MKTYTYSEARKNLDAVLDEANTIGVVAIRRKDGRLFRVEPLPVKASSLADVRGVQAQMSCEEIVACVREGRER